MSHRTRRSVVVILCAWGVLAMVVTWLAIPRAARADGLDIHFDDIANLAQERSPRARMLEQRLAALRGERDEDTQWSNPWIAYDHEEYDPIREWQVVLGKEFVLPFATGKKGDGWEQRVRAGELLYEQESADLVAELRSGYVRLQLLDAYLVRLEQLREIVTSAAASAVEQHSEGTLSGVERHLILLSAVSIDASRRTALSTRGTLAAAWKADMGIAPGAEVTLATPIGFKSATLASTNEYIALFEQRPAVRSRMELQEALGTLAEAASPSLVPGFDLYAGYRHIEPLLEGFVGGVSLSLPLFDRKGGTAQRLSAEQRAAESALVRFRSQAGGEIQVLVDVIEDAARVMETIAPELDAGAPVIGSLHQSYTEGFIDLNDFLTAIQIEVTGYRDYYDQLTTYYANVFRLEAMAGTELVSFTPQEDR